MPFFYIIVGFHTMFAIIICRFLLPNLVKLSPRLKLVDMPTERKNHKKPIPAIGGLVIIGSIIILAICSQKMQAVLTADICLSICLLILLALGITDDRINLSAHFRFIVQFACAYAVASNGIRIQSWYGIFGINEMSLSTQYLLTVFIIVGATNAFNLIDGIDGLAGSIALVNIIVYAILVFFIKLPQLLMVLLPLAGALGIFLWYNWRPAKLFLGDGGSMVLGFFMISCTIIIIQHSAVSRLPNSSKYVLIVSIASFLVPIADLLRLFILRKSEGRSPFSADRNHLHHLLLKLSLSHSEATLRIVKLHIFIILFSALTVAFLPLSLVLFFQIVTVSLYIFIVQFNISFIKWYRIIKKLEFT